MGIREIAEQLARVPMFSGCSARELSVIARAAKEVTHPAGTVIAREGEPGVGMFLILEGRAEVSIGGRRRRTLGPGGFFGEIALLDGGRGRPRSPRSPRCGSWGSPSGSSGA